MARRAHAVEQWTVRTLRPRFREDKLCGPYEMLPLVSVRPACRPSTGLARWPRRLLVVQVRPSHDVAVAFHRRVGPAFGNRELLVTLLEGLPGVGQQDIFIALRPAGRTLAHVDSDLVRADIFVHPV